jgi:5'/3'-nucleotidase
VPFAASPNLRTPLSLLRAFAGEGARDLIKPRTTTNRAASAKNFARYQTLYILLTNDDGVDAPGLSALRHAVIDVGRVEIIAPQRNWTAAGHTKTMHKPLRIHRTALRDGSPAYTCSGSPSDCAAVALLGFLDERPALIVSGINPTSNVGYDITYSGTIAAAMEAAVSGVPAFAVSLDLGEGAKADFSTAAHFAGDLARKVLKEGLPRDTFLNVNVPAAPREAIRGVRITRSGRRIYRDQLIERVDPRGGKYYWIGGEAPTGEAELEGTDVWALANRFISITPIHMDMTSHELIAALQDWPEDLERFGAHA